MYIVYTHLYHSMSCLNVFRLLEAQLQTQSRQHKDELEALHTQVELLKDNLEKKQDMLNHFSTLSPDALVEFSVQQEITRLTNENLVRSHLKKRRKSFLSSFFP